ncbi:MAG: trimeric intracellular cation channel family protein [Hyphomicrobiales bacterium]|nr:trimeric intracellular cation channel family protein [Hyphomicrobiales bacterium]
MLTALDLIGVFVFALSGGVLAVEKRFDPFGVVFLAFVSATSGGIVRDLLIGATPPAALQTWHYVAVAAIAGGMCYFGYDWIMRLSAPVTFFDSIGLGLFAVVGARKALDAGLSPLFASLLGMVTAVGGGMARDILTAQAPMVLHREIYALAALGGAALLAYGDGVGLPDGFIAVFAALFTIVVRLTAVAYGWSLPAASVKAGHPPTNA